MIDLDKYTPGQVITSMTRRTFSDLWKDVQSGAAQERWPEGKVAETRKERTEDLRIRAIAMIFKEHHDVFDTLLTTDDWRRVEVYIRAAGVIGFRVLKDQARELENLKALRRRRAR